MFGCLPQSLASIASVQTYGRIAWPGNEVGHRHPLTSIGAYYFHDGKSV